MASKRKTAIDDLIEVMARLRSPNGCPWDREQDHKSIRFHAVEEVYELIDAIESEDDHEMLEECGDLLLQVVFHCQLAKERKASGMPLVDNAWLLPAEFVIAENGLITYAYRHQFCENWIDPRVHVAAIRTALGDFETN